MLELSMPLTIKGILVNVQGQDIMLDVKAQAVVSKEPQEAPRPRKLAAVNKAKRSMSAAVRKKIAVAMRKRWASKKREER